MLDTIEDKLYTEVEAAKILRCSRVSLWRWREAGELGYISMGGKVLYSKQNLQDFIQKNLVQASNGGEK